MGALIVVKFIILYAFLDVATANDSCAKEFRARGYIPKYAKGLKRTDLKVKFENTPVECGGSVSLLSGTISPPTLKIDLPVDKCRNVTVIGFSPDIILSPPYLFWLVHNVPSVALRTGWTNGGSAIDKLKGNNQGDVKASYVVPKIPAEDLGIGNNTEVILIYCQCRYISDIRPFQRTDRLAQGFDVKKYVAKQGLKCPVAGLFYQVPVTGVKSPLQLPLHPLKSPVKPGDVIPSVDLPAVPV